MAKKGSGAKSGGGSRGGRTKIKGRSLKKVGLKRKKIKGVIPRGKRYNMKKVGTKKVFKRRYR